MRHRPTPPLVVVFGAALSLAQACGGGGALPPAQASSPPVLLTSPVPRVVPLGSSWTFTVLASGEGLAHQWRKSGVDLAGATGPSYTFTPTSLQDGGNLEVVVRNAAGSVTSPPVEVRVVSAQGPWTHDLKLAVGASAETFGAAATFVAQAGVPSLARRANGQLVAVFQWFPYANPSAFDRVAASFSTDGGRSWSTPQPLTFNGLPAGYQRPFDPTVTVAEDGGLRLYFTCSPQGPAPANGFYSARSSDGLGFTFEEGVRFYPGRATVDCAVLRWNGLWHLVSPVGAPQEGAYHAVSTDGLGFTRLPDLPSIGGANWTGNLVAVDGALRFYGSPGPGLWFASTTDGTTWSAPVSLGIQGGDPAVVEAEPGRWLLVFTGN